MSLPVALQLYSVRNEAAADLPGTLAQIKAMGYQGVELAGIPEGYSAQQVQELLQKIGLEPISAHIPLDELLADPVSTLRAYREIGCRYVAIPFLPEERRPGSTGFAQTIADIRRLGTLCGEQGLTLLYHNHDFEFVKLGERYGLDVLYDEVDASLLQTEIDTCWVKVAGVNPSAYLLQYSGRAPVVHLKDFYMKDGKRPEKLYELMGVQSDGKQAEEELFGFRPVGEGQQDMPAVLASCEQAGASWVVVEQDLPAPGDTALDSVKRSRAYLAEQGW